jgi:excisionase family DNA binding protein
MKDDPSVSGPRRGRSADERSLTLREVSRATGIPMPTLLRYKREQPKRVPSSGSGSQQRFPEAAVAAFLEIHGEENPSLPQRGRRIGGLLSLTRQKRDVPPPVGRRLPPKPQAEGAPAKPAAPTVKLMTLREISEITGVAYPTIARYAAHNGKRIPHVGTGRNRRFPPEAVEVFRSIRKESRRGRPPKNKVASPTVLAEMAALTERIAMLERSQAQLEEQIRSLLAETGRSAEWAANEV